MGCNESTCRSKYPIPSQTCAPAPTCPPDFRELVDAYRAVMLSVEGGMMRDCFLEGKSEEEKLRVLARLNATQPNFDSASINYSNHLQQKYPGLDKESYLKMFFDDLGNIVNEYRAVSSTETFGFTQPRYQLIFAILILIFIKTLWC